MYWFKRIAYDLFSFSVFFFHLVVVKRTVSWLVEQDGVCIVFCLSVFLCLLIFFLLVVVVERTMSWLVEQDEDCIVFCLCL